MATARLGFVADPLPGHERFRGYLAIPYLGHDGRVLQVRFRCPQNHDHREFHHGKYMTVKDDPARVFNVGAVHRAGATLHVAEGELDALILNQIGLPAIALPGATQWKPHYRRMLAGFNRVWIWGDPDEAGAELVNKVTRHLRSARGVRIQGGDVSEVYAVLGATHLLGLVEEARA